MQRFILMACFVLFLACSKDSTLDTKTATQPEPEQEVEKQQLLNLTHVQGLATPPFETPATSIDYEGKLYVVGDGNTYTYDFSSDQWNLIYERIANPLNNGWFNSDISFLRDGRWFVYSHYGLWSFDFVEKEWMLEHRTEIGEGFHFPTGTYLNGTLYIFDRASRDDTIYTYDFENHQLVEHGSFDNPGFWGFIRNPIFKVGAKLYYLHLTAGGGYYNDISVYEINTDFKNMTLLDTYRVERTLADSAAFLYDGKIIFGLGGDVSGDGNGNITTYGINDKFNYYDPQSNTFHEMPDSFYEGRINSLPATYNNESYLLNGRTIKNNESENKTTLDKLTFEFGLY